MPGARIIVEPAYDPLSVDDVSGVGRFSWSRCWLSTRMVRVCREHSRCATAQKRSSDEQGCQCARSRSSQLDRSAKKRRTWDLARPSAGRASGAFPIKILREIQRAEQQTPAKNKGASSGARYSISESNITQNWQ